MFKSSILSTLGTLRNFLRKQSEVDAAAKKISLRTMDASRSRFINTASARIPVLMLKKRTSVMPEAPILH